MKIQQKLNRFAWYGWEKICVKMPRLLCDSWSEQCSSHDDSPTNQMYLLLRYASVGNGNQFPNDESAGPDFIVSIREWNVEKLMDTLNTLFNCVLNCCNQTVFWLNTFDYKSKYAWIVEYIKNFVVITSQNILDSEKISDKQKIIGL